jgi:hypothetical protein
VLFLKICLDYSNEVKDVKDKRQFFSMDSTGTGIGNFCKIRFVRHS